MASARARGEQGWNAVWVSDVHLGTRACRAAELAAFLNRLCTEKLYLVGDIIDLENLQRRFYWCRTHDAVLAAIRALAARGTEVIYIPGNHDAQLRGCYGRRLLGATLAGPTVHLTADGRRLLVTHGDEFDDALRYGPLVRAVGGAAWDAIHAADVAALSDAPSAVSI